MKTAPKAQNGKFKRHFGFGTNWGHSLGQRNVIELAPSLLVLMVLSSSSSTGGGALLRWPVVAAAGTLGGFVAAGRARHGDDGALQGVAPAMARERDGVAKGIWRLHANTGSASRPNCKKEMPLRFPAAIMLERMNALMASWNCSCNLLASWRPPWLHVDVRRKGFLEHEHSLFE